MLPPKKKNISNKTATKPSTIPAGVNTMNGHKYDVNNIKDFYTSMVSANWYKDRLRTNGYGLKDAESYMTKSDVLIKRAMTDDKSEEFTVNMLAKNRLDSINRTEFKTSNKRSTSYTNDGTDRVINIHKDQLNDLKAHPRSATVHEYGHSETDGWNGTSISGHEKYLYNQASKGRSPKTDDGLYVSGEEGSAEAKSDINTIRYNLYKSNKFNPKTGEYETKDKKFNKDMIPGIKNDYNTKRMLDAYGEDGLTDLMNTIANNKKQTDMKPQYMAMGGKLKDPPTKKKRPSYERAVYNGVSGIAKDVIQAEVISKVLNKGDQLLNKVTKSTKGAAVLDTAYDAYNTIKSYGKGDMVGMGSNFVGALLPGVSGKTIEAVADNYLPRESQEGQDANAFIANYGTGSLGKQLLDTYGQGYKSNKEFQKDLKNGKLKDETSIKNHIKNYKKPSTPIPTNKYAMGGNIRPSSRQRAIAPVVAGALISGGISMVSSLFGMSAAQKAKKEQEALRKKAEQDALAGQYRDQAIGDMNTFNNSNQYGEDNVEYYANGGSIEDDPNSPSDLSPDQMGILQRSIAQSNQVSPDAPVSESGYQTKGGILKPIGDGMEEVVGNRHNDTKIDGVSGVQLHSNGELEAEVEDKEVIADGEKVYSHRLKYDKKDSYADKIKKVVKQRNKLEKKQDKATSKREKNTIERQLAGLNMAENAVFRHQEEAKYREGIQVADTFAMGGRIKRLVGGGATPVRGFQKLFADTVKEGKYAGWRKNALGQMQHPSNKKIIVDKNGTPNYPYNDTATAKPASPTNAINAATATLGTASPKSTNLEWDKDKNGVPDLVQAPDEVPLLKGKTMLPEAAQTAPTNINTTAPASAFGAASTTANKFNTEGALGTAAQLAPLLLDNIGNAIMSKNTPKLTTPLLNRAATLESRVNINPQLAEIRRGNKAAKDSILNNTSNSNNAKANAISADLNSSRQQNELIASKDNQELALRNADSQNKQNVSMSNNATMNQHAMNQYQRSNDIRTQVSGNLANLQGDIKTVMQMNQAKDNFSGYTMANLADDDNGTKMMSYMSNEGFMKDPKNKAFILSRLEEKDADGKYKFEGQRIQAKRLNLLK